MPRYLLLLVTILVLIIFTGCSTQATLTNNDTSILKFSDLYSISDEGKSVSDNLRNLDNKTVKILGFMAEQSPVDKSFVYLVNKPYTVCPFCVIYDNTKLEVISIYMNNKSPIEFTNQPVEIVGRLEVDPKVDEFNYTTQFRIYAKKVTELKNFNFDKEAMSYFQQMNRDNIIAALQIAFVNINQSLYPEILNDSSLSTNKKYSIIKEKLNLGFISKGAQVMKKNLNHIETIKPSNTSVMKIHNDLIALFAETVALLEDIDKLNIEMSSTKYSSDEEKEKLLTTLYNLYERNKDCFEKFTLWNDSIR